MKSGQDTGEHTITLSPLGLAPYVLRGLSPIVCPIRIANTNPGREHSGHVRRGLPFRELEATPIQMSDVAVGIASTVAAVFSTPQHSTPSSSHDRATLIVLYLQWTGALGEIIHN